ncbi:cardiolipin synthase [Paramaledivibacter caminithermalis]|jgi:cardiolipin synthase|uniref:Cardiolipin synthase n=1 Tax=Paramaledivibacter caminithermalis (strain DSM 15212 / CIP 107654 / DViRD3) TaxID=1121301 RepID=A0A1M6QM34_PARC5|nr:cardiolipin synthase [Paramaledivibacter caminithermalis]SHK21133.1 cardiolipin synthetase 2 [Paramaledivibacter caminithermalis DSM 15212]
MKMPSKRIIAFSVFFTIIFIFLSLSVFEVTANITYDEVLQKITTLLGIIFTVYAFFIGMVIFLENNNPSKTIAWLLVLFLVPVVGFVFYILFGQNVRKKKRFEKKKDIDFQLLSQIAYTQEKILDEIGLFGNDESMVKSRLIKLLLKNSQSPFTVNNNTEVLTNGESTYCSIIDELKKAKHHIHMQYFIIRNDNIGNKIKDILIEKVKSGIEVRLIYDSVGCWKLGRKYINSLKEAGVKVYPFYPVMFPVLSRQLNYRNHRKIIVIDGKVGYIGGINIGDEYLGKNPTLGFWRDTHIKIEGEAIYSLQNIFLKDWYFVSNQLIIDEKYYPKLKHCGEQIIQITSSGPDSDWESILQAYFTMISTAEKRIWITTPYLVPDESILMALKTAALSGIDVRIIIPSKPDHYLVYWASKSHIEELLLAGVKVYTYEKGFIHSKLLLVDGISASIGTANLDIRSFSINFEVNAFIYDNEVVKRLEHDFVMDIKDSKEIILEEHLNRGMYIRFREALGRLFSPLL